MLTQSFKILRAAQLLGMYCGIAGGRETFTFNKGASFTWISCDPEMSAVVNVL